MGLEAWVVVPWPVYAVAAGFVLWSVAMPFGHFHQDSLVKEFYTDGFQRFGAIYALAEAVPPANPFVAGLPLRYYWFSLAPIAALARTTGVDVFAAWKVALTLQAFAFVVSLWWVAASTWASRRIAWVAVLLAIVIPSAEILWNPSLREALSALGTAGGGIGAAVEVLSRADPDHVVGVIVPHSDQILMEDFLYIPQNAAALGLFLVVLWSVRRGSWLTAGWATALYVGTNTFFVLPGALALGLVALGERRWREVAALTVWTAGWSLVWATLCRIVTWPARPAMAFGLVLAAVAAWAWVTQDRHARPAAWPGARRAASAALVVACGLLVAQRPTVVLTGLAANYGVALLLAGVAVGSGLGRGSGADSAGRGQTLLLWFAASFFAIAAWLVAPFWQSLPAWAVEPAFLTGDLVNPFNYYHKVAKGLRITICLVGAAALGAWLPWIAARGPRLVLAALGLAVVLPVSGATSVIRPLTYLTDAPGREAPAARLLVALGASLDDVVLLEDYRTSQINQLAPVSTYFISSWSGGARSLSNAAGTWADQYVPTRHAREVADRERTNAAVFEAPDVGAAILDLGARSRIDYVLTRHRLALGPAFTLLVDWPGGYLYAVGPPGGAPP